MDATLDLSQFISVLGGSALITSLVELVKRTLAWNDATTARFAPMAAVVIGALLFVGITLVTAPVATAAVLAGALLGGVVSGLTSCGLYGLAAKPVIESIAGPAHP